MQLKNTNYLIIIAIFCTSCSFEQNTSYFPLEEGLQWRYQVTKITRDGVRQQKYIYISLADRIVEEQTVSVRKTADGSLFYYPVKLKKGYCMKERKYNQVLRVNFFEMNI
jgi:hypothetical protein